MKRYELYVGLRIKASKYTDKDLGTITEIDGIYITVKWDLEATGKNRFRNKCKQNSSINSWQPVIELTKEQRIHHKIKNLWNTSKWVQNNPSRAY